MESASAHNLAVENEAPIASITVSCTKLNLGQPRQQ